MMQKDAKKTNTTQLPKVPSRWWEALLVALGVYVIANIVATAVVFMTTGVPEIKPGSEIVIDPVKTVWIALVMSVIGLIALLAYVGFRGKRSPLAVLGLRRPNKQTVLIALVGGIIGAVVLELLLRVVMPSSWLPPHPFTEMVQNGTTSAVATVFIAGVVIGPIFEELLFRGYIFSALSQRIGFVGGALISSLFFALLHPNPVLMAFAFLLGLLMCWTYNKSGSLWLNIPLHMLVNATAFAVAAMAL